MPSALHTERCSLREELGGGSEDPASVHAATSMEPTCQSFRARKVEIYRQCHRTISVNSLHSVTPLLFEAKPLGGECGSQTQSPNLGGSGSDFQELRVAKQQEPSVPRIEYWETYTKLK